MPDRDDLDHLIYEALASYADPGPNSGLERRVLTRINTARASRRHRRLIWAAVLPAAVMASVLLLFVASTLRRAQPHVHSQTGARIEKPVSSAPIGKLSAPQRANARSSTRKAAPHTILRASAMPKLDIFPTPVPLSSEEKALVDFAAAASAAQRQDLTATWQPADEPIHIAEISIPSINPPAEGKE